MRRLGEGTVVAEAVDEGYAGYRWGCGLPGVSESLDGGRCHGIWRECGEDAIVGRAVPSTSSYIASGHRRSCASLPLSGRS